MPKPVRRVICTIQMTQTYLPLPQQEKVCGHNAHDGRQEDRERAEHADERRGLVHKLPRLTDPSSRKGDQSTPTDINVAREQPSKVDTTGDGISADVFEASGESEAE